MATVTIPLVNVVLYAAEAKTVFAPVIQMVPPGGARALQGTNGSFSVIEFSADDAGSALFNPCGPKTADVTTVVGVTYPVNAASLAKD